MVDGRIFFSTGQSLVVASLIGPLRRWGVQTNNLQSFIWLVLSVWTLRQMFPGRPLWRVTLRTLLAMFLILMFYAVSVTAFTALVHVLR